MVRTLPARWLTRVTGTDTVAMVSLVRNVVLVGAFVTVPLAVPHLGSGPRGVAVAVALGVSVVSWIVWLMSERSPRRMVAALAVLGAAGGVLAGLSPLSLSLAIGCVVASAAGVLLTTDTSLAITAGVIATFLVSGLAVGAPALTLLGYPLAFIGLWSFGMARHGYLLRAEQAEQTLAETRRALAAETHAAALAERARMAREIHDVLAHSLAAVAVNLQAAEGLLAALPEGSPELGRAVECIERAGTFTREGLAEARRAVQALRDDADDAPLADQLATLAKEWQADGDAPVEFSVSGSPRPVAPEAGLAVYRTAQEALTNARKHAPGQPLRLSLEFSATEVAVRAVSTLPPGGTEEGPLARAGSGYGLKGLGERAALTGGTLTAGPADGEWRVCLRIPA